MARTAEAFDPVEMIEFKAAGAPSRNLSGLAGGAKGPGATAQNVMLEAGCASLSRPTALLDSSTLLWQCDFIRREPLGLRARGTFDAHGERVLRQIILEATVEALRAVTQPRFFRSERGYQGRFYCALQEALDRRGVLEGGSILEMEYQKARRQQMTQRPDIILHIPAEESGAPVWDNNLAVFALKRKASPGRETLADFAKMEEMCDRLRYPLAVFINVDASVHHLGLYSGRFRDRVHAFAVSLDEDGTPLITHAWLEGTTLRERQE